MKAQIEINGIVKETHTYESQDANGIIEQLMADQDLYCLTQMGPQFGDDVSSLKKLMEKYENDELSPCDIKDMNIELDIGSIKCVHFEI